MKPLLYLIAFLFLSIQVTSQELTYNTIPYEAMDVSTFSVPAGNSQQDIAEGNNKFAFELYHQLVQKEKDSSLFYSPFSISTALAMVYGGAKAETALQIAQTMNFSETENFHNEYKKLMQRMTTTAEGKIRLDIANGMWDQKDFPFLDSYINIVKSEYNSEIKSVDFTDVNENEKARNDINHWVELKTNNKIQNLIDGPLDSNTRLILVNAIYFFAGWQKPFIEELTTTGDFYLTEKSTVEADMMNQSDRFNYYEDSDIQAIEIPYAGNTASMVVFLPKDKNGIRDFETVFNYQYYLTIVDSLTSHQVRLSLPKFKSKYKSNLEETLSNLGMPLAFTLGADFSGMTGNHDLFIGKVIHQAFISVDEHGTEAAAATAVIMERGSALYPDTKSFIVDHPLLFCIKDNETGSILFMGKIVKP